MASKCSNMAFRPPLPPQISRKTLASFNRTLPTNDANRLNINTSYMDLNTMNSIDFHSQSTEEEQIEQIEDVAENEENEDFAMNTKKNITWGTYMDDFLINYLIDQVRLGQKIGGSFTSSAYRVVAKKVSGKFGVTCQSSYIINHLKMVKQNFAAMHDLMISTSGFGFTQSTQMIEVEASVWEAYLIKKPKASKYRHQPATGSRAAEPTERKRRLMKDKNNIHNDDSESNFEHSVDLSWSEDNVNLGSEPVEPTPDNSSTSISKSSNHKKKRNKKVSHIMLEELRSIGEGLSDIASALNRANVRNFDDNTLFEEIENIDEMSEIIRMKIYQALTNYVKVAWAFLGCPVTRHRLWLEVQFDAMLHGDSI